MLVSKFPFNILRLKIKQLFIRCYLSPFYCHHNNFQESSTHSLAIYMNHQLDNYFPAQDDHEKIRQEFDYELNQGQPTYIKQLPYALYYVRYGQVSRVKQGISLLEDLYIRFQEYSEKKNELCHYLAMSYFKIKNYEKASKYLEELSCEDPIKHHIKKLVETSLIKHKIGKFSLITGTLLTASIIVIKLITRS